MAKAFPPFLAGAAQGANQAIANHAGRPAEREQQIQELYDYLTGVLGHSHAQAVAKIAQHVGAGSSTSQPAGPAAARLTPQDEAMLNQAVSRGSSGLANSPGMNLARAIAARRGQVFNNAHPESLNTGGPTISQRPQTADRVVSAQPRVNNAGRPVPLAIVRNGKTYRLATNGHYYLLS